MEFSISIPADDDSYVLFRCPICKEYFKVTPIIAFRTFSLLQGMDDEIVMSATERTPRQIIELYQELFDNYRS